LFGKKSSQAIEAEQKAEGCDGTIDIFDALIATLNRGRGRSKQTSFKYFLLQPAGQSSPREVV
jgi:hypothetical protein